MYWVIDDCSLPLNELIFFDIIDLESVGIGGAQHQTTVFRFERLGLILVCLFYREGLLLRRIDQAFEELEVEVVLVDLVLRVPIVKLTPVLSSFESSLCLGFHEGLRTRQILQVLESFVLNDLPEPRIPRQLIVLLDVPLDCADQRLEVIRHLLLQHFAHVNILGFNLELRALNFHLLLIHDVWYLR